MWFDVMVMSKRQPRERIHEKEVSLTISPRPARTGRSSPLCIRVVIIRTKRHAPPRKKGNANHSMVEARTLDLDVHLERRHTVVVAGHLEVHVSQGVLAP